MVWLVYFGLGCCCELLMGRYSFMVMVWLVFRLWWFWRVGFCYFDWFGIMICGVYNMFLIFFFIVFCCVFVVWVLFKVYGVNIWVVILFYGFWFCRIIILLEGDYIFLFICVEVFSFGIVLLVVWMKGFNVGGRVRWKWIGFWGVVISIVFFIIVVIVVVNVFWNVVIVCELVCCGSVMERVDDGFFVFRRIIFFFCRFWFIKEFLGSFFLFIVICVCLRCVDFLDWIWLNICLVLKLKVFVDFVFDFVIDILYFWVNIVWY